MAVAEGCRHPNTIQAGAPGLGELEAGVGWEVGWKVGYGDEVQALRKQDLRAPAEADVVSIMLRTMCDELETNMEILVERAHRLLSHHRRRK